MTYSVKEIFFTVQGEGARSGRPAVFLRFAGCNLWTGLEKDRSDAVCKFCDTDFVGTDGKGGGKFSDAESLARAVMAAWPGGERRYVVCTGGEPLLQLDGALIATLHHRGFEIAVETNGTLLPPQGIDWICVSPKADSEQKLKQGDELKLVYPQTGGQPDKYAGQGFNHFFLQPMDGPGRNLHTRQAAAYCLENPKWRLSLQTHKLLGIP
jgi:7-carboxy-7-deazaguanine synthase (Cx14CxxC type)